MKNQYAGDLHDYRKLGILRILADFYKNKIGVVWMLTENDDRADGKHTNYLFNKKKYRGFDDELYDKLHQKFVVEEEFMLKNDRKVVQLQEILNDLNKNKFVFFNTFKNIKDENIDLLFFDPDNGLGFDKSEKHLSWEKIEKYQNKDLLFVHFLGRNKTHTEQIEDKIDEIKQKFSDKQILAIKAGNVAYFYIANSIDISQIKEKIEKKFKICHTSTKI